MACRALGVVIVSAMLASGSVWVHAQSGASALQGAWMLEEYSYAKPAPVRIDKPAGLLFFSGNHYAYVMVRDTANPRPDVGPEGADATADQLRATWGPLQAQAGTFEIAGNRLTTHATVAKSPANNPARAFLKVHVHTDGRHVDDGEHRPDAEPSDVEIRSSQVESASERQR